MAITLHTMKDLGSTASSLPFSSSLQESVSPFNITFIKSKRNPGWTTPPVPSGNAADRLIEDGRRTSYMYLWIYWESVCQITRQSWKRQNHSVCLTLLRATVSNPGGYLTFRPVVNPFSAILAFLWTTSSTISLHWYPLSVNSHKMIIAWSWAGQSAAVWNFYTAPPPKVFMLLFFSIQLVSFLENNISCYYYEKCQSGFRSRDSSESALLEVHNEICCMSKPKMLLTKFFCWLTGYILVPILICLYVPPWESEVQAFFLPILHLFRGFWGCIQQLPTFDRKIVSVLKSSFFSVLIQQRWSRCCPPWKEATISQSGCCIFKERVSLIRAKARYSIIPQTCII